MHTIVKFIASLFLAASAVSFAHAQAAPRGTYSDWQQPSTPPRGFYNLDISVRPVSDPQVSYHGVFYAHQFQLRQGPGGYIGIQKDLRGKRAIFSIWNALSARGPGAGRPCTAYAPPCAGTFGGEGVGFQTMVPYEWQPGHAYRYRVWTTAADANGTWWGGWLIDDTIGRETLIGEILVPASVGWLDGTSYSWVEYYGSRATSCGQFGYSDVYFDRPRADAATSVAGPPNNHLGPGDCQSQVTTAGTYARHQMGLN